MKKNYRVYRRAVRISPAYHQDNAAPTLSESAGTLFWLFGSWRRARRFLRQEGRAARGRRRYQGMRGRS